MVIQLGGCFGHDGLVEKRKRSLLAPEAQKVLRLGLHRNIKRRKYLFHYTMISAHQTKLLLLSCNLQDRNLAHK
jgi:hypothetical protein